MANSDECEGYGAVECGISFSKESEQHWADSIPNRCLQWVQRIGELEKEVVRWKSMYEVTEKQLKNISEKYHALVQNGYVPLPKGIYCVLHTLLGPSLQWYQEMTLVVSNFKMAFPPQNIAANNTCTG
jgi:hypothetical protein